MNRSTTRSRTSIAARAALALAAAWLSGCGGGGGSGSTPPPSYSTSAFVDAPVAGVCYTASPSGAHGATATDGSYSYLAGDTVTFWIDGSGSGCTGSSSTASTSVALGSTQPTGATTFVLTLNGGAQVADTVSALNVGTASAMNVAGLRLNANDVANLMVFIGSGGSALPASAAGSIDNFYAAIQADTTAATGSAAPTFALPVAANPSTSSSVLENTVAAQLQTSLAGLASQPTTFSIPAGGLLRFAVSTNQYRNLLSATPTALISSTSANFQFFDGQGHLSRIGTPNGTITSANLADVSYTGTYTVNPSSPQFSFVFSGVNAPNGQSFTQTVDATVNYQDASSILATGSFSKTWTSGPNSGSVFQSGTFSSTGTVLTPLSLALVAGHQLSFGTCGSSTTPATATFSADGSTLTQSCGGLPFTLALSPVPGILQLTDSSGLISYAGLVGGLAAGYFITIQENAGSLGTNGNGNAGDWHIGQPFTLVH